jgi:non-lysosomal glucosylceramidase
MAGFLYLGALRAAEEIARHLGEVDLATEYRRVYESGRDRTERELWNGHYYIQVTHLPTADEQLANDHLTWHTSGVRPGEPEPRYQYGPGCLSDQLLGQWLAEVVGLGHLVAPERVRSTVSAIFENNFKTNLANHESCQRTYALNDEAGLLLCSWPNGGRPRYPFPYADEVWTGVEYQVAAHLIYEGLVDEGLKIVAGTRSRHDGARRNPWNEFECGHHYARALASWSVLLALSGYHYSAPEGRLTFAPRINALDFRCFFSAGDGWGSFRQLSDEDSLRADITIREGTLALQTLSLSLPVGTVVQRVTATAGARALTATVTSDGATIAIDLGESIALTADLGVAIVAWIGPR